MDIDNLITYKGMSLNDAQKEIGSFLNYLCSPNNNSNWIKNSDGEIVSQENIDSYIPELDLDSVNNELKKIFSNTNDITTGNKTWSEYFETLKGGKDYIVDLLKSNDDLSKLTANDLVTANQNARQAAIAHNDALKQQTLGAQVTSVAMKALSTAGNMIAFALISKGIELIVKGFDNWIHRVDNANEAMNNAISEYESAKSNIESINSELDKQNEKLAELEAKGSLTYTEEGELEKLQLITKELALQKEIEEKHVAQASKEAANKTVDAYKTQYGKKELTEENLEAKLSYEGFVSSGEDDVYGNIAAYVRSQKLLEEEKKAYQEALAGEGDTDSIEDELQDYVDMSAEYKDLLDANMSDLIEKRIALQDEYHKAIEKRNSGNEPLTTSEKEIIETYEKIAKVMENVYKHTDPNTYNSLQMDKIFATDGIEKTKEELIQMAKDGTLDENTIMSFENLNKTLENTDMVLEDGESRTSAFCKQLYALADAEKEVENSSPDDILDSIKKASDGMSVLVKTFQEVSDKGYITIDTVASLKEAVGDSIPDWDEYQHKLLTTTKGSEEFNAMMSELTYNILENKLGLKGLANADQAYVEAILRENGIVNASAVAHDMLAKAKAKEYIQTKENIGVKESETKVTANNINELIKNANAAGITTNAYIELKAKEILFGNNNFTTKEKCKQLIELAKSAGIASVMMTDIDDEINRVMNKDYGEHKTRKEYAESLGMGVITKEERIKRGEKVPDGYGSKYVVNGVEYETFRNARYALEAFNLSNSISNTFSNLNIGDSFGNTESDSPSQTESKEEFNWIETALSRIQRTITNLGKTVSATWRSWTDRNKALKDQVSAVTQEINLQEQAYNRYMALANGTGLPEPYRSLVENGAIDISTITDETLAEQIKTFQDYYEKALACKDAVSDLNDELANLVQTEFDHTAKRYDDELSMHEHQSKMLQSSADILETKGYMVGSGIYDALARQEEEKITALQNKYASLESVLNSSNIPKYSEQWYAMQLEIAGVAEEIQNSQKSLAEYNNTLREIDWELFDKLQEKLSGVTEESEFLIELMSDKKMFHDDGSATKHGQATLGLHAVNYNTYMAHADEYATELEQIQAELANAPYNQTLLERRNELLEQQRDMILAAEKEKQSMKDLKSEGYDALLDSMSSMIDKRKEMFSQIKDLYDYEKSIAEQTAEVSKYQKLMDSMQGMADTEEGRATLQKYEVSLKEAKENLEETEYDRYIKDQEQLLDSLYDQTEEWVNSRLDDLDGLISEVIESTNANTSEIQSTLKTEAENVGATLSTEMEGLWSTNGTFTSVVSTYGSGQLTTLQEILATMKQYFSDMQKDAKEKAKEEIAASAPTSTPAPAPAPAAPQSSPTNTSSGNSTWGSWFIKKHDTYPKGRLNRETSVVDRLKFRDIDSSLNARAKYYSAMGGSGVYTGSSQQNQWMIAQMKAHGFTDGGRIGPLIKASGEDGFILAKTGEEILSLEKIRALGESFALINPVIQSMVKLPAATDMEAFQPERMVHIDIGDIQMYGVNDPETFAIQLKENMLNNGSIRKIIKDTTFGEALGKNSMIRYTR